jgi:hypothetical protein
MKLNNLGGFGICDGVSEVIVTTKNGSVNAAPIGIIRKRRCVFARIYEGTTLENIHSTGMLVANVTSDPRLFVISALGSLDEEHFDSFCGLPAIRNANAWILFKCKPRPKLDEYSVVLLDPTEGKINKNEVKAINRGLNAVIDATVHATRYVVTKDERLKQMIDYCNVIVSKCGGEEEKRAMGYLYRFLDQ